MGEERKTITLKGMEITAFNVDRKFFNVNGIKSKMYCCYNNDTNLPDYLVKITFDNKYRIMYKPDIYSSYTKIITFDDITKTFTVMEIIGNNLVDTSEGLTYEEVLMKLDYKFAIEDVELNDFNRANISKSKITHMILKEYNTELTARQILIEDEDNKYLKPVVVVYGRLLGTDIYWVEGEETYEFKGDSFSDSILLEHLREILDAKKIYRKERSA